MKVLVELDFLLYGCRLFAEMELPKGHTASEIEHRKDIIEDFCLRGGDGFGAAARTTEIKKPTDER